MLKAHVDQFKNDPVMGCVFEAMMDIDDADIFYNKKQIKLLIHPMLS